ncbi:LysM domain-containing protein, partial [Enterococcus faecalis]
VLVILLFLIFAIPIGTFLWMMQVKKPNESASKNSQPSSSLVQSSSKEMKKESTSKSVESSEPASSQPAEKTTPSSTE